MHDIVGNEKLKANFLNADFFESVLPADFQKNYLQKNFLHLKSAFPKGITQKLLSHDKLDNAIRLQRVIGESIHLVSDGMGAAKYTAKTGSGLLDCYGLRRQIASGATTRLTNAQEFDPDIKDLCEAIEAVIGQSVNANVYITPAGNQGFNPHYDAHDVFVVQCMGRKHWSIYHQYAEQIELPNKRNRFNREVHKPISEKVDTLTLEEGDVLYIPRGVMHDAHCEESFSGHITFGVYSMSWTDYIIEASNMINAREVGFRKTSCAKPFSRKQALTESIAELPDMLDKILSLDPAEVERSLYRRAISEAGNPISGTFSTALKMEFEPALSGKSYTLICERGVAFRLFQSEEEEWQLWTYEHTCGLNACEAELVTELKECKKLSADRIRQVLGAPDGDEFSSSLLLAGIVKLDWR